MSEMAGDLLGIRAGIILGGLIHLVTMARLGDLAGVVFTQVTIARGMILGMARPMVGEAAIGVVVTGVAAIGAVTGGTIIIIILGMWVGLTEIMRMAVPLTIVAGGLLTAEVLLTIEDHLLVVADDIQAGVTAVPLRLEDPDLRVALRLPVLSEEVV